MEYAVSRNAENITKMLLEKKADVNHQNKYGNTALHIAVHCNHTEAVRILLENNADVTLCNTSGYSALRFSRNSHLDISEMLVQK